MAESGNKKIKIVTHSGGFHADDTFAVAVLSIAFDGNIEIVRTRDPEIIDSAEVVVDVGGLYDSGKNRFDHHQTGGAGIRENGVWFSSIGLVWQKFGEKVTGSKKAADIIDRKIIQFIDASDTGTDEILAQKISDYTPYLLTDMVGSFVPTWRENPEETDDIFANKVVPLLKQIIEREIIKAQDIVKATPLIQKAYDEAEDKRIIVLDQNLPWSYQLMKYSEPLFVILPKDIGYCIYTMNDSKKSRFSRRIYFPESWAGKKDEELSKISGVEDAVFCHNGCHLAVTLSKEGAIALAKKTLEILK
jgi:uncharacterized UPF0160 family protein